MIAAQPADAAARADALATAASFLIDAPAGSGKTTLITQRFLRLLTVVEQPEAILAITFTRKAAEEMRSRIIAALRVGAGLEPPDDLPAVTVTAASAAAARDADHGWGILDNPARLRVLTIDGFAAGIARNNPITAGFDSGTATLDDARQLYDQAALATIEHVRYDYAWSRQVDAVLAEIDNDWSRLQRLLSAMLAKRDQWLGPVVAATQRAAVESALAAVIEDHLATLHDLLAPQPDICGLLVEVARFAGANLRQAAADSDLVALADLTQLPAARAAECRHWCALAELLLTKPGGPRQRVNKNQGFPAGAASKAAKAQHQALLARCAAVPGLLSRLHQVRQLPPARFGDAEWARIGTVIDVLKLAVAELELLFNERGVADFIKVSTAAQQALGAPEAPTDYNLYLDCRLEHLLVDEFQDTSVTQCRLLETLTAGWTGSDGRTVCLVGDAMQSIYRFRQAEVGEFVEVRHQGRFGSVPLSLVRLTANFRSVPAIVDWVNQSIAALPPVTFGPPIEYVPMRSEQLAAAATGVSFHPFVRAPATADDGRAQAERVVQLVAEERARRPHGSIVILVRNRGQLGRIPRALVDAGIPVAATEIDGLASQPVANDLLGLTRALMHLSDRTAWLAVLRAPWCGLSLPALTALAQSARLPWETLADPAALEGLADTDRARATALRERLRPYLDLRGRAELARIVEGAWRALEGPTTGIAVADAEVQAARYFELLSQAEQAPRVLTGDRLDALVAEAFAAAPAGENRGAVEIMTVHRAKGLEFDCVIMPALERGSGTDPHELLMFEQFRDRAGRRHRLFAPVPLGDDDDGGAVYGYLRAMNRGLLDAETRRLLYVALTRARSRVHLVATLVNDDDEVRPPRPGTLLDLLWPVVEPGVAAATPVGVEPPVVTATEPVPAANRLWRRRQALPPPPPALVVPKASDEVSEEPEFDWAQPLARHVGTVAHATFARISRDGVETWDAARISGGRPRIEAQLRRLGVAAADIDAAAEQVVAVVLRGIEDRRGRWILGAGHQDAASELALTARLDGAIVNVVLDRTFVDSDGTRWIIDYKTGDHGGGSREAFIASEIERYTPQLERYARVIRLRESRPIALGLYFPAIDAWHSWRFEGG